MKSNIFKTRRDRIYKFKMDYIRWNVWQMFPSVPHGHFWFKDFND